MDDLSESTLECPRCGRVFSLELTRCPGCGLNMYPEDEAEAPETEGSQPEGKDEQAAGSGGLWAVILGWILAGAVSFIIQMFASQAVTGGSIPVGWKVTLYLASPLGAVVGGAVAGTMVQRGRLAAAGIGALVGIGAAGMAVLFETRWRLVTLDVILEGAMLAQYVLCIILGLVGASLNGKLSGIEQEPGAGTAGGQAAAKGMSWEDLMYRDLLTRVRFNRDTADRLIEYERRLAPEADRYTLLRNAVERLERDRH